MFPLGKGSNSTTGRLLIQKLAWFKIQNQMFLSQDWLDLFSSILFEIKLNFGIQRKHRFYQLEKQNLMFESKTLQLEKKIPTFK